MDIIYYDPIGALARDSTGDFEFSIMNNIFSILCKSERPGEMIYIYFETGISITTEFKDNPLGTVIKILSKTNKKRSPKNIIGLAGHTIRLDDNNKLFIDEIEIQ
jgi:hypothetical protein